MIKNVIKESENRILPRYEFQVHSNFPIGLFVDGGICSSSLEALSTIHSLGQLHLLNAYWAPQAYQTQSQKMVILARI